MIEFMEQSPEMQWESLTRMHWNHDIQNVQAKKDTILSGNCHILRTILEKHAFVTT